MASKWQENNSEIIWGLVSFPLFTTWRQDPNVVGESQVDLQVRLMGGVRYPTGIPQVSQTSTKFHGSMMFHDVP